MLSYRHAFHAGNHADVLKHFVLMLVLKHAAQKDKPFWYIDTHAGAGMYALDNAFAMQNAEFNSGISRLWDATDMPTVLADYVAMRALVRTDPKRLRTSSADTILSVIEAPMGSAVPLTLTAWDLSFLRAFYASGKNNYAEYQRSEMQRLMKRELDQAQAQAQ